MSVRRVLSDSRFELPREFALDYQGELRKLLKSYYNALALATSSDNWTRLVKKEMPLIREISDEIVGAIEDRLRGRLSSCESRIAAVVTMARPFFTAWETEVERPILWYRIRRGASSEMFARSDLFHIPLNKLRLIGEHRYGYPGVPCLYLGATTYVCWEECGRPDLNALWLAAFRVDAPKLRLLDLGYPPQAIAGDPDGLPDLSSIGEMALRNPGGKLEGMAVGYSVVYPIIAAASFQRSKDNGDKYHPEYIISQTLLRVVMENQKYDGIRYLSTRIPPRANFPWIAANLVLPVQDTNAEDFCTVLRQRAEMTEPVPWQLLEVCEPRGRARKEVGRIPLAPGFPVNYADTLFAQQESKLLQMPFGRV